MKTEIRMGGSFSCTYGFWVLSSGTTALRVRWNESTRVRYLGDCIDDLRITRRLHNQGGKYVENLRTGTRNGEERMCSLAYTACLVLASVFDTYKAYLFSHQRLGVRSVVCF